MSHIDDALATFAEGFNCAQAVFATYGPSAGLDRDTCLKIAGSFGGGMARCGQTCGAVTGALMVIGLRTGTAQADDSEAKARCYRLVKTFIERFKARHNTINCNELLGVDMGTPEGFADAMTRDIHHQVCPAFVRSASEILEDLFEDK